MTDSMAKPVDLYYKNLPDNSVVCLMSPTASGKTDLACQLYDTGRFELISVDSALIYRGMNIGTAKPSADELIRYPHHLVDIIDPTDSYSVANFVADVERLIVQIHAHGKIPLLVGGTMMYYMALFDGISSVPETNPAIRTQVTAWRETGGNSALYDYLLTHDPIICEKLTVHDTQRISRAVEVHLQTGIAMSTHQATPKQALSHNQRWQWYGLMVTPDRAWLHERIEQRLDIMWADGFLDEVITLLQTYPDLRVDMPSLRCVGYRQVIEFLASTDCMSILADGRIILNNQSILENQHIFKNIATLNVTQKQLLQQKGEKTLDQMRILACQDMKNKALYATRQLAKRQYTWLKQLSTMNKPADYNTFNNVSIASFDSIKQVQQQFLQSKAL